MYVDGFLVYFHTVVPEKVCGIPRGTPLRHGDGACSQKWRNCHKDVSRAVAFVFMVEPTCVSRLRGSPAMRRGQQLLWCFIKIVDLVSERKWLRIESENVIHALTEERGEVRDAPHFFPSTA